MSDEPYEKIFKFLVLASIVVLLLKILTMFAYYNIDKIPEQLRFLFLEVAR